ncbi:hypothetical protein HYALB_00002190 [Hymenoscyphus albidus]|uniref:Uncharacterized protein n=1 Tax=Hymenoscyphus albidus TaxID=595503 RepID=A0A9N9LE15_9HELO|nr:hypothetical protein HYALB_00002190 [Hymenoscyphus albidus]
MDPSATRPTPDAAYYTTHPFVIFNPDHSLTWLSRIGPENTSSLHTLRIMIHAVYNPGPNPTSTGTPPSGPAWIALFNYLSYYATGLKEVKVHWDSDAEHYGGGADGEVVRALAGIGGLERLELGGFYLETWPGYLEENTGAKVVEEKERGKAAYWVELARWRRHFEVGVS